VLRQAAKRPELCRRQIDLGLGRELLVGAPPLFTSRDHAQDALQLAFGVAVPWRREGLADPFRLARAPQGNVWKKQRQDECDRADDGGDEKDG